MNINLHDAEVNDKDDAIMIKTMRIIMKIVIKMKPMLIMIR